MSRSVLGETKQAAARASQTEGTACAQGWVILKVWKYLWGRERVRRRLERWAGAELGKALNARPVR